VTAFLIGAEVCQPTDLLVAHALEAASQRHDVPAALLRSIAYQDTGGMFTPSSLFRPHNAETKRTILYVNNPVLAADYAAKLLKEWHPIYRGSWVHVLAAWRIGHVRVNNMVRGKTWELTDYAHDYIGNVLSGAGMPRPVNIDVNGAAL